MDLDDLRFFTLGTPIARWAFVFLWGCGVAQGVVTGALGAPGWTGVMGHLVALIGCVALTSQQRGSLPRRLSLLVAACALVVGAIVIAGEPTGNVWLFDFAGYLLALLAVRGRPVLGSASAMALFIGTLSWGMLAGRVEDTVVLISASVFALLGGLALLAALQHIAHREARAESESKTAALRAAVTIEAEAAQQIFMAEVLSDAAPVLEEIASRERNDASFIRRISVVEGRIRDRIRAANLRHERLARAIARARSNGARVLLLGGGELSAEALGEDLAAALSEVIERPGIDAVTLRRIPTGRRGAVSVIVESGGKAERLVFDQAGIWVG